MRVAACVLLFLAMIIAVIYAQSNSEELTHRLLAKQAQCMDMCMSKKKSSEETCASFCSKFVTDESTVNSVAQSIDEEQVEALSDSVSQPTQEQANKQLYELFHKALQNILAVGPLRGFQVLDNALELTDITSQIQAWDQKPLSVIEQEIVNDYDNPEVLGSELIYSSKPGPIRDTNDLTLVTAYRQFLSGIKGVSSMKIPEPAHLPSTKRLYEYQNELIECGETYFNSPAMMSMFKTFEEFSSRLCHSARLKESAYHKQLGVEQYKAGNKKMYGAAVALGVASDLYSASDAFKKFHSFRALEYECSMASLKNRKIRGVSRSIKFNYNYKTWKNTQETLTWKTKSGGFIFKKTKHHTRVINTNFDATSVGGVEISFADYRHIPVYPGKWFSSSAIRDYRNLPRNSNSPISRFFGEKGSLTLVPKSLHVAVNPKISFWVASSAKSDFKETARTVTTGGFSVFGFGFKSSKDHQVQVQEGESKNGQTKITITGNSCKPQLFAVEYDMNY